MGFLHPSYLVAALVALVPLVIHLLHRQRVIVIEFPSLEFLRRLMRRKTRRFQLRQLLLLILRILIMLFLALALARPTLTGTRVVHGHLPTTAVIILDNSLSMMRERDGEELFEIAKRKALELLDYFDASDEVYVTLTGGKPVTGGTYRLEDLKREVANLRCSKIAGDMATAIGEALDKLRASSLAAKEIYIISDMQKGDWGGLEAVPERATDLPQDLRVMIVDLGDESPNACVKAINLRLPVGESSMQMEVTFQQFGRANPGGRVAEVYLRDRLLDRGVFSPGEVGSETRTFEIPSLNGPVWGEVAIAEDHLPVDDRRYFAYSSPRRRIAVVGDSYYIKMALAPRGEGRFNVAEIEPGAINDETLAGIDALVISNVARFAPLEIEALTSYLESGGGIVMFLGDATDVGAYNRKLLPLLGDLSIEAARVGGGGFYTIDKVAWDHPIFSKFKRGESPFVGVNFYSFLKIVPGQARVLAWFSDGSPALVEPRQGILIFASSADGLWNDLVATGQFVPILHEALGYVSSQVSLRTSYLLGEEISLRAPRASGEVVLDGPTGEIRQFPEAVGQMQRYRIKVGGEPGIYFLKTQDETLAVFALNVDVRESDFTKVESGLVRSAFDGAQIGFFSDKDDLAEGISLLRQGRDLLKYILWIVLALVVAESLIAANLAGLLRRSQISDALEHS